MGNFISTIREIFGTQAKTVNLVDEQGEELTDLDILDHSYDAQAESLKKGFDDLELLKKGFVEGGDEDKFLSKAETLIKGLEKASKRFVKTEQKYLEEATNILYKASDEKQAKVKKVMDEWKQGKLSSSSGDKVTSQKQAVAIALSEAGLSKKKKLKKDFQVGQDTEGEIMAAEGLEKGGVGSGRHKSGLSNKQAEAYKQKFGLTDDELIWREEHNRKLSNAKGEEFRKLMDEYDHSNVAKKIRSKMLGKAMDTGNTPGKETPIGSSGKPESIEQATEKNKIKKAEEKVEMPKKEFSNEHERLLHILEHGTQEERKKEADKQRKEVKERMNKAQFNDLQKAEEGEYEGHYAVVIVKDKNDKNYKILLLKRASDKTEPNKWCPPGGHIDAGETPSIAASRELKEETNLSSDPDQLIWLGKILCNDGKWAYYFGANDYIINNTSHDKQGTLALLDGENTDARYMSKDEWNAVDIAYNVKDHLRDLMPAINAMVSQARVIQQIA